MFLILSLLMANGVIAETNAPNPPDGTGKCVIGKALSSSGSAELAEVLAQQIASECAELLPQKADEDCGNRQAQCDAIVEETNAQRRDAMARLAYRAIVMFRQNEK